LKTIFKSDSLFDFPGGAIHSFGGRLNHEFPAVRLNLGDGTPQSGGVFPFFRPSPSQASVEA